MTLLYVYAMVRPEPERPLALGGLTGVGGTAVDVAGVAPELAAVVSAVPEAEFGEAALRVNLEDLDWVEGVARAHDHVVRALSALCPVLPLRLAVLHRDADALRASVAPRAAELTRRLDAVAGAAEWGVAVDLVPAGPEPAAAPPAADGRDYLRQRRAARLDAQAQEEAAAQLAAGLAEELTSLAREARRLRPQPVELTQAADASATAVNIANHAYLVPEEQAGRFRERAAALSAAAPAGVRVRVTGPWAPYSFAAG